MTEDRIATLRQMSDERPGDPRPLFGIALEYEKQERWAEAAQALKDYLARTQDEGNAYGRLGAALRKLGNDEEAKAAYRDGIEAAYRHGHPTMAGEFEEVLDGWD
jgi:Flp pilus assembly protein TadD